MEDVATAPVFLRVKMAPGSRPSAADFGHQDLATADSPQGMLSRDCFNCSGWLHDVHSKVTQR